MTFPVEIFGIMMVNKVRQMVHFPTQICSFPIFQRNSTTHSFVSSAHEHGTTFFLSFFQSHVLSNVRRRRTTVASVGRGIKSRRALSQAMENS